MKPADRRRAEDAQTCKRELGVPHPRIQRFNCRGESWRGAGQRSVWQCER